MSSIPNSLLKLAPLNPILLRVVTAGGRRFRHALIRWGYLALLIIVLLIVLAQAGSSLGDLAKASTNVFQWISYLQLGMISLLAPIFTAAAITQERDSRTYNILLSTPLTNGQIVIGSLFSRLYFVIALLLSGIPVFAITLFYGGVTARGIALSFAIALSTGLFTGALAIAIAVFRLGTGKTVFWFYVFNAVYLVGLWLLDNGIGGGEHTTFLTGIHPFLALRSIINPRTYPTPAPEDVAQLPGLIRFYLLQPAYAYLTITLSASLFLISISAIVLRKIAQRADIGLFDFLHHTFFPKWERAGRRARTVWTNPIAWREAATRAGLSARGITRYGTIAIGLAAAIVLLVLYHNGTLTYTNIRYALLALIWVEFSVSLLVATNSSASAVTRERESQTLDLLLVTPITSRYYIWGKLRGLVAFMIPFAMVPTLTILLVVLYDLFTGALFVQPSPTSGPIVFWEALIEIPIFLVAILAWACMLGLQLSLKWTKTIMAVMASVGVLAGICAALGFCGFASARGFAIGGIVINAFSPFTALGMIIDPTQFAQATFDPIGGEAFDPWISRTVMAVSILTASGMYCLATWSMYKSMVKNFDMIIRRQHQ